MAPDITLNQDLGFLRVAAASPPLQVANVDFNVNSMMEIVRQAKKEKVQVLVFPEMSITGYTIGELVFQQSLLDKAREGLKRLADETKNDNLLIITGLPLGVTTKIYNCAAVISSGKILGVIPKVFLPNYREYYEDRWFQSGSKAANVTIELAGQVIPFGTDILFKLKNLPGTVVGVEICEDLWVPVAPHACQALAGATVLVNISASNDILGKPEWRRTMVESESGRCLAAYCYASAGIGESSNDVVYGGHCLIAENGIFLAESERLTARPQLIVADIDIERLEHDRQQATSFFEDKPKPYRIVETEMADLSATTLRRFIAPHPFVPDDPQRRAERCRDIFAMQVGGLAKKLTGSNQTRTVIGVSGGLDSALALLVCARTMDLLGLGRENIHAFTLPGFGTTDRTRNNASKLCQALGTTFQRININRSARAHLADLGHTGEEDIVFENVQARYRTDFLFDKANQVGGILVGTGDLTEVALGWSTFSGDQISHYHVNTSVPKTLVKYLIRWVADEEMCGTETQKVLLDILDTPISPELLRKDQRSEDTIGPVELADFYLYPFVRFGMRPGKILYLADAVRQRDLFESKYSPGDLHRWLSSFIQRFFANQFKRTCLPEGPKVGSVSLSPRGDWRMPSDASPELWQEDLDRMYEKLVRKQ